MDFSLVASNLLNPPILFFFLGMAAVLVGSDLEIPQPVPKFISLYLLLSIGFKGGAELSKGEVDAQMLWTLLAAVGMAFCVPLYTFFILRRRLDAPNAAALAATYGSISAVTFIAATSYLAQLGLEVSGHMVAAMALMESPAIVVGVALARRYGSVEPLSRVTLFKDAFLNGSVLVLIGSLVIGMMTGAAGEKALAPFVDGLFKGMLCFFLLDMGIVSARRLSALRKAGGFLWGFALGVPLLNAAIGIGLSHLLGLSPGNALLFTVLCASASYIAVPAAMRLAVPQANPGLYVSLALAVTFPFNVLVGVPLYMTLIRALAR